MNYVLDVKVQLDGDSLIAETEIIPAVESGVQAKYIFRLRDEEKVIDEIIKIDESSCSFKLPKYGQYFVMVSYSCGKVNLYKSSKLILYSRVCPEEYEAFCDAPDNKVFSDLTYFEPDYPNQDFCLFRIGNIEHHLSSVDNLMKERNMHTYTYTFEDESICRVLTSNPVIKMHGKDVAFSGVTRTADRLIVGDRDLLKYDVAPEQVKDEIGDFWAIYQENEKVFLIHDFLGLSKFYYYQDGADFVVSNRYHLLLLALKSLGISPKPCFDRMIADLSSVNAFARLNYSRNMLMQNTYVLTSDKDIVISKSDVLFTDNELHDELFNPEPFDESRYEELVHIGANEMLDNMRLALEYPGVENFKIDLSGGLDSRMIFALITKFPQYREKVQIHALDLPAYPKDIEIALELNSIYDYPYITLPINSRKISKKQSHEKIISGYLCTNQQVMPIGAESSYQKPIIDMPGLLGELVFRPHMYTKFKGTVEEDNVSVAEFIDKRIYSNNIESVSEKGMEYFLSLFNKEMEMMAGDTPVQKFQNHYLIFMDTIHHSTYFSSSDNHTIQWVPLLSKTIFHLNNVSGIRFRSNKLAYDLMRVINPVLAAVPYEKMLYNNELAELAKSDPRYAHTLRIADECIEAQRKKWEEARNVKAACSENEKITPEDADEITKANENFFDELKQDALAALKKIIKYDARIGEIVGLECYSRICGNSDIPKNDYWIRFLYNKILTVYHALRIFDLVE